MNAIPTIEKVDGQICVKDGFSDSFEPQMIYNHWPIGNGIRYAEDHIGEELSRSGRYGYKLRLGPFDYVNIDLIDHGETKSIKTTFEPVPKPKTRVKIRWHNGRWEKLLKSKGWVLA